MPSKDQTLKDFKTLFDKGVITKSEVFAIVNQTKQTHISSLSEILYYIGGSIIFLGLTILIAQNWSEFTGATKILVSLGSAVCFYILGLTLQKNPKTSTLSKVFHVLSVLLFPFGLYTTFDTFGIEASTFASQTIIASLLAVFYIITFAATKSSFFLTLAILASTWAYFSFTNFLIDYFSFSSAANRFKLNEYRILTTGIAYLFGSDYLSKTRHSSVVSILRFLGINSVLATIFSLGGWSPNQNIFWELIYPMVLFCFIFGSIKLKSQLYLVFATLYLMAYILKITSEYFKDTVGWSLALVIAGFLLIGIGYLYITIKNRYLNTKTS